MNHSQEPWELEQLQECVQIICDKVRQVVHRLDPLRRPRPVVNRFKWLGEWKLVVQCEDGTFQKDWEYEYDDAAS